MRTVFSGSLFMWRKRKTWLCNFVTFCLSLRYKRKGTSSLGLNSQRQAVTWDDTETKKKQKGKDSKKAADRYYSTASRQMLRSEPPVPVLPSDNSDDVRSSAFLSLGGVDEDNKKSGTSLIYSKHNGFKHKPVQRINVGVFCLDMKTIMSPYASFTGQDFQTELWFSKMERPHMTIKKSCSYSVWCTDTQQRQRTTQTGFTH